LALGLQYLLLQHGGLFTLGVNSCVITAPALAAAAVFASLRRWSGWRQPWFRILLVAVSSLAWTLSLVASVTLLVANFGSRQPVDIIPAVTAVCHPAAWIGSLALAALAVWFERRLENRPEFPLGMLLGELTVL